MQLLEDFLAFSFELTNFYLFQQKIMPALLCNDVTVTDVILVVMLLQTIIEVFLSISASKVH